MPVSVPTSAPARRNICDLQNFISTTKTTNNGGRRHVPHGRFPMRYLRSLFLAVLLLLDRFLFPGESAGCSGSDLRFPRLS